MYKLKSIAQRGTNLGAAIALAVGAVIPAVLPATTAYADALNPLTERSLTLSSSSPGWAYTDGSGNSTYAPPNSGANGQKSGNYFSFKVSTDSTSSGTNEPIKAISFQYCTQPAGQCAAPGDNGSGGGFDHGGADTATTADLNVTYPSATEIGGPVAGTGTISTADTSTAVTGSGTHFLTDVATGDTITTAGDHEYTVATVSTDTSLELTAAVATADVEAGVTYTISKSSDLAKVFDVDGTNNSKGLVSAVPGYTNNNPKYQADGGTGDAAEAAQDVAGNFLVVYKQPTDTDWSQSTGWTVSTSNQEEATSLTSGKQNTIVLENADGLGLATDSQVKIFFFATATNYITNPGSGYFFVKINTFKDFTTLANPTDLAAQAASSNVIDGGVTVANVMNQSIQITTKVLETMQFSVGTVDPNTLDSTDGTTGVQSTYEKAVDYQPIDDDHKKHGTCDIIRMGMTTDDPQNVLELGNQDAESSLSTDHTYATHSYWRLSSNSSAGATVYYSGHTLSNTSGDEIEAIGKTKALSTQGSEQFGLAIDYVALAGGNDFDDASYGVDYSVDRATGKNYENAADTNDNFAITGIHDSTLTDNGATHSGTWDYTSLNGSFHMPHLDPLTPASNYASGSGKINDDGQGGSTNAMFAFDKMSDTVPAELASESNQVVDCVTAKMRYIANIAATTPAGIYTTKINYIAAPQY